MISAKAWRQIQQAFKWQCAYCRMPAVYLPQGLQKEHIVPRSLEGPDAVRNICPACPNCNSHKTNKILGTDPESGEEVPLFNPRRQNGLNTLNGIKLAQKSSVEPKSAAQPLQF